MTSDLLQTCCNMKVTGVCRTLLLPCGLVFGVCGGFFVAVCFGFFFPCG